MGGFVWFSVLMRTKVNKRGKIDGVEGMSREKHVRVMWWWWVVVCRESNRERGRGRLCTVVLNFGISRVNARRFLKGKAGR